MSERILTTIADEFTFHRLTEEHLDEWFRSLTPDRKVALFHDEMDAFPEPPIRPLVPRFGSRFASLSRIVRVAENLQQQAQGMIDAPFVKPNLEGADASL